MCSVVVPETDGLDEAASDCGDVRPVWRQMFRQG